jgi:Protein of unknown function (DUF3309)
MSLSFIALIILVLLLFGALPVWPYSTAWGVYPAGGFGILFLILLLFLLLSRP